ncbi:TPA: hypothetical protein I9569_001050 [Clostridioides difficile]|nr:hypothetical protein [Clostridioides difficile]
MEILNLFWDFILTMWYVNAKAVIAKVILLSRFYINYVVCKSLELIKFIFNSLNFILTMWYVNKQMMLVRK